MNWYVLYTKSRCEKAVAAKLASSGIEVYCPLLKRKKLWSDRWKWVEEPLFRSYCFVRLEDNERDRVFTANGVVRYLYHCGKPAVVRDEELELLKNWLNEYSHDSIQSSAFRVHDKVLLKSGALMDQKAEVLSKSGNYLTLFLETLGMQIKVDLRKNIIEKIPSC
ncbi:UpxY family transcription antiterminator [Daejeonella sp. JGW-45]|uniref:transcription termination/antitermination protein NusG n=1 Tax=Daejeonella sp. JGW-45 TaxID=3034148 RepID=UPI0023EB084C|nr:UpxY family transcription antiterminator [Daejeonella sp. JGW-45]